MRAAADARQAQVWWLGVAAAWLLSACGGGSDGETQYAVRAAMGHWLEDAASWSMTGTTAGQRYTLNYTIAPLAPATTPIVGAMAARSRQTFSAEVDGATIEGSTTMYFDPSTQAFFGSDNGTGSCDVTHTNTPLPAAVQLAPPGQAAQTPFYTDTVYAGCTSGAAAVSTAKGEWALQTVSGMVMLCWKVTVQDLAGAELATQSTCLQIASDGTLGSKASLVATVSGITILDARNF